MEIGFQCSRGDHLAHGYGACPAESSVPDAARASERAAKWLAGLYMFPNPDSADQAAFVAGAMALADAEVAAAVLAVQADNNRLADENAELKHRLRHLENLATYPDQRTADNNRRIEAAEARTLQMRAVEQALSDLNIVSSNHDIDRGIYVACERIQQALNDPLSILFPRPVSPAEPGGAE